MAILQKNTTQKPQINLSGSQGNAFFLLGTASKYAKELDLDEDKIQNEMKSGDYENLIEVFDSYFGDYIDLVR